MYNTTVSELFNNKKEKCIFQFDLCGNYITYYKSVRLASIATSISCNEIINVCENNKKQAGGYYWSYKKRFKYRPSKYISVACYTLDGKFIQSYTSVYDAAKYNNITENDIYVVIAGQHKTCKNIRWRYFYGNTSDIKSL